MVKVIAGFERHDLVYHLAVGAEALRELARVWSA
jgi:hypothetical protein